MSVPPESIEIGKCYLGDNGKVWRVVRVWPDSRVQFEFRARSRGEVRIWKPGMLSLQDFAEAAQREVPSDWTPKTNEAKP